MPFVLSVLAVAVAVSYLRGGRLRRIAHVRLRHSWLLFAGAAVQLAVDLGAGRGVIADAGTVGVTALMISYVLIVGFVALNWTLPGVPLLAIGLACNALVIGVNGAMPVSPEAVRALGLTPGDVPLGKHTVMTATTGLPWLADIWALPPLRTIISIGDVVIAAGTVPLVHGLMGPPAADEAADAPYGRTTDPVRDPPPGTGR